VLLIAGENLWFVSRRTEPFLPPELVTLLA
jgi:hypothetical protein